MLENIPSWLGGAIIGAVIALMGYVGKLIYELLASRRETNRKRRTLLINLNSLIQTGKEVFSIQSKLRDQLASSLGTDKSTGSGFEDLFTQHFEKFNAEQSELHKIIRAYTESVHSINKRTLDWLMADDYFKAYTGKDNDLKKLSTNLQQLETHLELWMAKYQIWIPGQPHHALVYLADEKEHGIGFPHLINDLIPKILGIKNTQGPSHKADSWEKSKPETPSNLQ